MDIVNEMLRKRFGICYMMPYQELVIRRILEDSRRKEKSGSITIFPTGGGKSLCFMLPSLLMFPRYSVIIYPLLSLMNDQKRRFDEMEVQAVLIRGGLERTERAKRIRELKERKANILITNVESLYLMFLRDELNFLKGETELFVLDEAHTVISWGESFRSSYRNLGTIIAEISPHQILSFSATIDRKIERRLRDVLYSGMPDITVLRLSCDRENIFYHSVFSLSKLQDILFILKEDRSRPALVFAKYRSETKETYLKIREYFPSFYYHAGLEKEEKEKIEKAFAISRDGVMIATNAYGMGVDKKDIRTVIHLHIPEDALSFLQEAGRGGRDNGMMDEYVLIYPEEESVMKNIFISRKCMRKSLLSLMGEKREEERCQSCSACTGEDVTGQGWKEIRSALRIPFLHTEKTLELFLKSSKLKSWKMDEIISAVRRARKWEIFSSFYGRLFRKEIFVSRKR